MFSLHLCQVASRGSESMNIVVQFNALSQGALKESNNNHNNNSMDIMCQPELTCCEDSSH